MSGRGGGPIVQYWHAERPPERIRRGLDSFPERNPDRPHLVFHEADAEAFIAANLSPREVAAFRACAVPAMQSDFFRYCAIFVLGGIYVDADFRCVADLRPLIEAQEGTLFGRLGGSPKFNAALALPYPVGPYLAVGNSPMAFRRAGHPVLELAIEVAAANVENRTADGPRAVWLTTGPGIFTSMNLLDRLGSADAFLAYSSGTGLDPSARLFCEVVGSHSRVAGVLAGVAIRPREQEVGTWVQPLGRPEPGEAVTPHWASLEGSIFRSPGPADGGPIGADGRR
jgi:Glycosyltransferase sugar-binding region containing DXD motif